MTHLLASHHPDSRIKHRSPLALAFLLCTWLCLMTVGSASAFDELNEAQNLIYDTGHLANTEKDQIVSYRYRGDDSGSDAFTDSVTLTVLQSGEEGRRDVELQFLTGERQMALPPFTGYRGNPVIIAMLEHIAQKMGEETGGGVLYFRNRIRDSLAARDVQVKSGSSTYKGVDIPTRSITFSPFTDDSYLLEYPVFRHSLFTIEFSDKVPAGVIEIDVTAQDEDVRFHRTLTLE